MAEACLSAIPASGSAGARRPRAAGTGRARGFLPDDRAEALWIRAAVEMKVDGVDVFVVRLVDIGECHPLERLLSDERLALLAQGARGIGEDQLAVDPIHVRHDGLLEDWGCDPPSPQGARWNCTVMLA
jgi:hypothetical protein